MGGEICPKMNFNCATIRHGREVETICMKASNQKMVTPANRCLDRFFNNASNALCLLLVGFSKFQASSVKNVANHSLS